MQELVILLLFTFSAGFFASLPPGLLNMNAAKTSVEKGKGNGIIFGLGVAIMVMLQTYLAVRIAKYLVQNPDVIGVLLRTALVVFAALAVFFFLKAKKRNQQPLKFGTGKKRNSFSKGLFLAALNLLTIPFYSGLNTIFHAHGFMYYKLIDEVVFIVAAGGGTFLAMYLYVFYFNKMERKTNKFSENSNYILSALMLVLLLVTVIRLYNQS